MSQLPRGNEWLRTLLRCLHLHRFQLKFILNEFYHLDRNLHHMSPYLHYPPYLPISTLEKQQERGKGNRTLPVAATDGQLGPYVQQPAQLGQLENNQVHILQRKSTHIHVRRTSLRELREEG